MTQADIQTLLNQSQCLQSCAAPGQLEAIKTVLLWNINIGSGGACTFQEGAGSPVGVKTPGFIGQLYHNTTDDTYWRSTGLTNSDWTQISGGACGGLVWGPTPNTLTQLTFASVVLDGSQTEYTFGSLTSVSGVLDFNSSGVTLLRFTLLTSVTSNIDIHNNPGLSLLDFGSLTTIGGFIDMSGCTSLPSVDLRSLVSVGGDLTLFNCSSATSLLLDALTTVGGTITFEASAFTACSMASLTSVAGNLGAQSLSSCLSYSAPVLSNVGGSVLMSGNASVSTNLNSLSTVGVNCDFTGCSLSIVSLPALFSVGGYFATNGTAGISGVSAPTLSTIGGDINFGSCNDLTSVVLSSLSTVGANLDFHSDFALTTLNLPSLVTVSGSFDVSNCTSLTSVSFPNWVPTDGTSINIGFCALDQTSVELILNRCVLAGVTTCTIDLSGGTNTGLAALSPAGQADYATLTTAGNTVTLNP